MTAQAVQPTVEAADRVLPVRLPSLTGLRWVGAMLVFGFHIHTLRVIGTPWLGDAITTTFALGLSGVQFFFILSGFVLVWSFRSGDTKWAFWQRRVAKVFPNHIVTWLAVVALAVHWGIRIDPSIAVTNLLLLQAWVPDWAYSMNTVSWSLSGEIFFYLCLPLVLPLVRRMPVWALWSVVVAVPPMILSLNWSALLVPVEHQWWYSQVFPLTRSVEFWLGVAAAELMMRGRWRGLSLVPSLVIFVATWTAAALWIPGEYWAALLPIAYLLVITAAADADVRGRWSPWRSRPLVFLGEVSFAFYMVHLLTMTTVMTVFDIPYQLHGWKGPVAVVGLFFIDLVAAWLLFRIVETPMMRILRPRRRRSTGRHAAEKAADATVPPPRGVAAEPEVQTQTT